MQTFIVREIKKLSQVLEQMEKDANILNELERIVDAAINALKQGKKILLAGNGGSAADAQHLAAELISRLRYNRPALRALALTTDTSALTAIGNDYAFEAIFSRQLEGLAEKGDVFIGISTSGKSLNVLNALETAKRLQLVTVGLTGQHTDAFKDYCDHVLSIPSNETPKIQECHILIGHILCALIEDGIFGAQYAAVEKRLVEYT